VVRAYSLSPIKVKATRGLSHRCLSRFQSLQVRPRGKPHELIQYHQDRTPTSPPCGAQGEPSEATNERLLRKLAPGGVFARINMSTNAQSSMDIPPLPQPPPAKRAKKSHPQLDPLDPAIHMFKQPPRQPTHTPTAPTNKGATVTPAEHVPHVLPGRRGDDVSIRQYTGGDKQLAISIASSASRAAKALQLI
jgi:hypothetical protein